MAETVDQTHVYDLAMSYLQNGALTYYSTGFRLLDRALGGGVVPGSLYIIGARPGHGKTSWALSIARRMAFDGGKRVVFLSLEMTALELMERMVCQTSRKTSLAINDLRTTGTLQVCLTPFIALCKQSKFRVEDERGATMSDLGLMFDEMRRIDEPIPEILFIDHLQHQLFTEGLSRAEAMANYLSDLKAFAKRHQLVIIAFSQLNRDAANEKSVKLHNLKSSGALEEVGDIVLLCRQPSLDQDTIPSIEEQAEPVEFEVLVAKNRRGPISSFTLIFNKPIYDFDEPEGGWQPKRPPQEVVVVTD